MSKKIVSPCISICKTDPVTGYCYGCARSNEEKKVWKDEKTSDKAHSQYTDFVKQKLFNKANHDSKLQMLTYLVLKN